jgi:enolase
MAVTISSVKARQIFDSRGNPTVEVQFYLAASFLDSVCLACFDLLHVFFLNMD